jgi:hypothetical protein
MALTNTRGIFALSDVRIRQNTGYWSSTANQYGYFGGGGTPSPGTISTVDRVDFSNDTATASIRGSLNGGRQRAASTGNASYGWFGGGSDVGALSTVDRIDYSNDTATASSRGNFAAPSAGARAYLAATGNSSYGYFAGGGGIEVTRVDRIDYANDTATSSVRGPISIGRNDLIGTGNAFYGWFGGGSTTAPAPTSTIVDRIDYSNDTVTAPARGFLSVTTRSGAATGNSSYGYFGAGGGTGTFKTSVDRIDYSNDTVTASLKGNINVAKNYLAASGNKSYGWWGGGQGPGSPNPIYSSVDRLDFSNDTTTASPRGPLSLARWILSSTSATSNGLAETLTVSGPVYAYGYFGGGLQAPNSRISNVDRIDYSNDTATASPKGPLSLAKDSLAATGNSSYGWFGGGGTGPATTSTIVDRIDYSNDTATASPRGSFNNPINEQAATGNSVYGYFGGGVFSPGPITTSRVERINYGNDTTTAVLRGVLTLARRLLAATGNSSYGWFGGGQPGAISTVDRIDYSNDTATASPKGPLSLARTSLAATGNSSYGWFGGGDVSPGSRSTVDRIDYSNDTATTSPRGPLSLARSNLAATGNSSYGWWGGGDSGSGTPESRVDRVDYSNDTVTASPRGSLTTVRYGLAGASGQANAVTNTTGPAPSLEYPFTSNLNVLGISVNNSTKAYVPPNTPVQVFPYGYFGGGGAAGSTIYRIDYNNDTTTASPRGALTVPLTDSAATGNNSYGYFAGGDSPAASPNVVSSVYRVDYINDTATASVRGSLSAVRKESYAATGNTSYGWYAGGGFPGDSPSIISRKVDRIDYSNDTATSSPRGLLSPTSRRLSTATGNKSYGWFGGGVDTGTTTYTIVDRIDYSNDTATASPRGGLNNGKAALASAGNSNYGWFGGGVRSNATPSLDTFLNTVDRIDYANDTATSSPRGNLTLDRAYLSATGNKSYGWFGGGSTATPATVSTVNRIDYSNDTATASPRGPLGIANQRLSATSPTINGFPQ